MTQLPDLFQKSNEFEISHDRKQLLINEVYGEETGGIFGFFTGTKTAKMAVADQNEGVAGQNYEVMHQEITQRKKNNRRQKEQNQQQAVPNPL